MVASTSRQRAMNASRSDAASSIRADRGGAYAIGAASGPTGCASTEGSARAGSVETSRVSLERLARSASAAAHVVFPTPPLPTTKVIEGRASSSASPASASFVVLTAGHADRTAGDRLAEPLAPRPHFPEPRHELRLAPHVLLVVDVAQLELHLQLHEVLLDRSIVGQLFIDDLGDFPQRPLNSGDRAGDWKEEDFGE